jgi:tetratricopeptide (TPR) repeat protein
MAVGTRGRGKKSAGGDADPPAFGGIAERYRRAGDLDRAVALCREGLKRFPDQISGRVTLGWALLDQGKYEEAQVELEYALKRAPDNLAAIRGLAELHDRAESTMMLPMDGPGQWPPDAATIENAAEAIAAEPPAPAPAPEPAKPSLPPEPVRSSKAGKGKGAKAADTGGYDTSPALYTRASDHQKTKPAKRATSDIDPPMSDAEFAALSALLQQEEAQAAATEQAPPPPAEPIQNEPLLSEPAQSEPVPEDPVLTEPVLQAPTPRTAHGAELAMELLEASTRPAERAPELYAGSPAEMPAPTLHQEADYSLPPVVEPLIGPLVAEMPAMTLEPVETGYDIAEQVEVAEKYEVQATDEVQATYEVQGNHEVPAVAELPAIVEVPEIVEIPEIPEIEVPETVDLHAAVEAPVVEIPEIPVVAEVPAPVELPEMIEPERADAPEPFSAFDPDLPAPVTDVAAFEELPQPRAPETASAPAASLDFAAPEPATETHDTPAAIPEVPDFAIAAMDDLSVDHFHAPAVPDLVAPEPVVRHEDVAPHAEGPTERFDDFLHGPADVAVDLQPYAVIVDDEPDLGLPAVDEAEIYRPEAVAAMTPSFAKASDDRSAATRLRKMLRRIEMRRLEIAGASVA